MNKQKTLDLFSFSEREKVNVPMFLDNISAGFPSPATDYMEK